MAKQEIEYRAPATNWQTRGFWEGCGRGELVLQRCGDCGRRRMPPRPMCPHCQSLRAEWEAVSGNGTIWSFIVPHPPLLPAYTEVAPFAAILVCLDEDPNLRIGGNLVGPPVRAAEAPGVRRRGPEGEREQQDDDNGDDPCPSGHTGLRSASGIALHHSSGRRARGG